jgi:hypothetical protein
MIKSRQEHLRHIADVVAEEYGMSTKDIFMTTRSRSIKEPRQIFHYLASRHTSCTMVEIGEYSAKMGRHEPHNHATVLNSIKVIKNLMESEKDFYYTIKKFETIVINRLVSVDPSMGHVVSVATSINDVFLETNDRFLSKIKDLVKLLCVDMIDTDIDLLIKDQQVKIEKRQTLRKESRLSNEKNRMAKAIQR